LRRSRRAVRERSAQLNRSWPLAGTAADSARARRLVRAVLTRWGFASMTDTAELMASELVTNALRHAGGAIRLQLLIKGREGFCAVWDADPRLPAPQPPDLLADHGRGMHLIDALAHRWGACAVAGAGKVVWFSLSLDVGAAGRGMVEVTSVSDELCASVLEEAIRDAVEPQPPEEDRADMGSRYLGAPGTGRTTALPKRVDPTLIRR
jgi:hypothetical protein